MSSSGGPCSGRRRGDLHGFRAPPAFPVGVAHHVALDGAGPDNRDLGLPDHRTRRGRRRASMFICARLSTWKRPRENRPCSISRKFSGSLARDSGEGKGAAMCRPEQIRGICGMQVSMTRRAHSTLRMPLAPRYPFLVPLDERALRHGAICRSAQSSVSALLGEDEPSHADPDGAGHANHLFGELETPDAGVRVG